MGGISSGQGTSGYGDDIFVTTRWTVVLTAADESSPQADQAMEEICNAYWFPLYAYIRRRGYSAADAEDLTQEFFCRLLEKKWIADADRERGKLRAFLITALKRFMSREWRKASAQKRGGGQFHLSIDTRIADDRYTSAVKNPDIEAEALFDHQWALTLLELTLQRLKNEYSAPGKAELFSVLKDALSKDRQAIGYVDMAERLQMSEGAVRVAVHRIRKRFRELYREEVAQTLPPDADLDDELHHLSASLVQG